MAAIGLSGVSNAAGANRFQTMGTAVGCGQSTCCQPYCKVYWKDSKGCTGDAESAGNCKSTFRGKDDPDDHGVDICDGAGMFFCETGNGRVIFVINTAGEVSAAHVPTPKVCPLTGQCANCQPQDMCGPPKYIGNIGDGGHNCKSLNNKLQASNNKPHRCS